MAAINKTTPPALELEPEKIYKDCVTATLPFSNNQIGQPPTQQQHQQDLLLTKVKLLKAQDCLRGESAKEFLASWLINDFICANEIGPIKGIGAGGRLMLNTDAELGWLAAATDSGGNQNGGEFLPVGGEDHNGDSDGPQDDGTRVLICSTIQGSRLR